jgi:hypothetical protein
MTAAVAAIQVLRRHRVISAMAATAVASTWLVVMAVVVVAMGGTPPPAELAASLGIPPVAMDAYQRAAAEPRSAECGLRWQVLAGIGRVESNHASGHTIEADGSVSPPILGVVLDGSAGTARVLDTDGGVLDADLAYDRAVGPMQFLPSSWALFRTDGNGDARADPNNLYDAAVSAAAHLCAGHSASLERDEGLAAALRAYNHSDAYVTDVLQWIHYYDDAALSGPTEVVQPTGNIVLVRGIRVDASLAVSLEGLLTAATDEGLVLSGGGYRTRDEQIALRRAHCGTSDYAVFDMPADGCSPPTARPGESMHESGLAIDFTCNGALVSRLDACFAFLAAQAASYGLFNLPAEPWHWSTNGR